MYLPNLITIGAMKCGTTSLHDYLAVHPDIYMSSKKEIDYFCHDEKYAKGIDWYKSFFPINKIIRGESSQNYSKYHWWKDVPKRIYNDLPQDVKFIYILRDPLKRVYSHYNEMQAQNCAPDSLEEYIKKDMAENEIVLTSCYMKQLEKYLEYFPLSSFKIITMEDLRDNRLKVMNELFEFLELSVLKDENDFDFVKNTSTSKVSKNKLGNFIAFNPFMVWFKRLFPQNLKDRIKNKSGVKNVLHKKINPEIKLSAELEEKLIEIFREDVNGLRNLTGLKFSNWSV